MLTYYLTLDLPLDADDEQIRQRYLLLVKKYTPEKYPEKFKRITEAYEALKSPRKRIRTKLFGFLKMRDPEEAINALADAVEVKRRRPGLKELFQAIKE